MRSGSTRQQQQGFVQLRDEAQRLEKQQCAAQQQNEEQQRAAQQQDHGEAQRLEEQ